MQFDIWVTNLPLPSSQYFHLNPTPSISLWKGAFWLVCVWSAVCKAFWVKMHVKSSPRTGRVETGVTGVFFFPFFSGMQILWIHFLQWTGWCQTWGTTCWKCTGNSWVLLKIILEFIALESASYCKYCSENNAKKNGTNLKEIVRIKGVFTQIILCL